MPKPPNERALALSVLTEITESGAYANIALRQSFARLDLDARGKAFVTELVNETLRNLRLIDYILDAFSQTPTQKMKPFIRNLLRLSVCQLRLMNRVPASAAVNEAVSLAKARGFSPLARYVNGVLRNIARQPDKPTVDPADIGLRFSCPSWLTSALTDWLGAERAAAFCGNSHRPPDVTICVNTRKTTPQALAERLRTAGIETRPGAKHSTIKWEDRVYGRRWKTKSGRRDDFRLTAKRVAQDPAKKRSGHRPSHPGDRDRHLHRQPGFHQF